MRKNTYVAKYLCRKIGSLLENVHYNTNMYEFCNIPVQRICAYINEFKYQ